MKDLARVQDELTRLADVLKAENAASYRRFFTEFLRENEFGLALHTICDYLIQEEPELISPSRIALVEDLHERMGIADDCLVRIENARLQAARGASHRDEQEGSA